MGDRSLRGGSAVEIQGLQKLTLLDYPGKVACTVFLGGCDLRCPFCHNGGLVLSPAPAQLDSAQLLDFLRKRRGVLEGVCVTGGEPLLRPELPELLGQIKALGYPVKLDTNGTHPQILQGLVEKKLVDYVAMDVKNCPDRYAQTVGVPGLDLAPIRQSVTALLSGAVDYEFRTTVVAQYHDERALTQLAHWIHGARRWYLQPFVDRDTVIQPGLSPHDPHELGIFLEILRPLVPTVALRGQ